MKDKRKEGFLPQGNHCQCQLIGVVGCVGAMASIVLPLDAHTSHAALAFAIHIRNHRLSEARQNDGWPRTSAAESLLDPKAYCATQSVIRQSLSLYGHALME